MASPIDTKFFYAPVQSLVINSKQGRTAIYWQAQLFTLNNFCICHFSVSNEEYYKNHYETEYYKDLDFDFAISGYNQGDYCKVKIVGNVDKWINKEYLTNIFYDTPISGIIEVFKNGSLVDEFNLYDINNFDEYTYYDKDKLITIISEHCKDKDYAQDLLSYLNDNLGESIEYAY